MPFTIDKDRVEMFQEEPLEAKTQKKSEAELADLLDLTDSIIAVKGGPGSGNWGHVGRPGKLGGSSRGGGLSAIGAKPGSSHKERKEASIKEQQSRAAGIVKIPPAKLAAAQKTLADQKVERDKDLKNVFEVDAQVQKASIANKKAGDAYTKANQKAEKSLKAARDNQQLIDELAKQEIAAGRLSPYAYRETNEKLKPFIDKKEKLDKKAIEDRDVAIKARQRLFETSDQFVAAHEKRKELPQGRQRIGETMTYHQEKTKEASSVVFQHNLNEAKRARVLMENEIRIQEREKAQLIKTRVRLEKTEENLITKMQKSDFPDNDPRAMKLIQDQLEISGKIRETNMQLKEVDKRSAARVSRFTHVDNPTSIKTAPGSQREYASGKGEWEKGRHRFEQLVSEDVVPSGALVQFGRTKDDRAYHAGGVVSSVNMTEFSGRRTMVHELGHMAEYYNPALLRRSIEWRDKRTRGEKYESLTDLTGNEGFHADEKAKADRFFSAYIGKDYGNRASEVFSMGIERMYSDPVGFAAQDPDMFDFIYAQARTQ